MTNLSPAALAVMTAGTMGNPNVINDPVYRQCIAAALRAAADQHTPLEIPFTVVDEWEKIKGSCASFYAAAEWGYNQALKELLAISDELEAER